LNLQCDLTQPDMLGDSVKPDFQSYTVCIMAYADSSLPNKVERALSLLDALLDSLGRGQVSVTRNPTAPFSAALTAISSSKTQLTASESAGLISEDGFTSRVDTDSDPYAIAKTIFAQVENDAHRIGTSADHHAVSAYLKCIVAHCAPGSTEREHTAFHVFENACEAGQVSRSVIQAFKDALGPKAKDFPELQAKTPPRSWSANVSAKFR
jgi:hypothetical protein